MLTLTYAFQGSFWALPKLLNEKGITVREFLAPTQSSTVAFVLENLPGLDKRELPLTDEQLSKIKQHLKEIVDEAQAYDSDEGVKSRIVARTAIDSFEVYERFQSEYKRVECEECEWKSVEHTDAVEHRCIVCDSPYIVTELEEDDEVPYYLYAQQVEDTKYTLQGYIDRVEGNCLIVEAGNIDWRGRSGHATVELDVDDLLEKLTVASDFRLHITVLEDQTLIGTCAHHDATMYFTVYPAVKCDYDDSLSIKMEDIEDAKMNARVVNKLLDEDWHEHLDGDSVRPALGHTRTDCAVAMFYPLIMKVMDKVHLTEDLADAFVEMYKELEDDQD